MDQVYENVGNCGRPFLRTGVGPDNINTFGSFYDFLEIACSLNVGYAGYQEEDAKLCSVMFEFHVDREVMERIGAFCGFKAPTNNMISGPTGTWCVGLDLISAKLKREFIRVSRQQSYLVAMPYAHPLRCTVFFASYIWFKVRPMHLCANLELQNKKIMQLLRHYPGKVES